MRSLRLLVALAVAAVACAGGEPLDTAPTRAPGHGPMIRWDLGARPLPEIPLPNDAAAWPDPTSPTGVRINASMVAPTSFESRLRRQFDEIDGWGTYQAITIPFAEDIDVENLVARQRGDHGNFANDAVYLVNLATGVPVPLDLGDGNFVYTLVRPDGYYANDPRGGRSNLIFEDVEEDANRNGRLDPGEDTNFDGVLNRAAVWPPPSRGGNPYDHAAPFWEPDSHTLILRPLVPMDERTRYAVVVTSRLRGVGGPARSPFATVVHPAQAATLAPLAGHLRAHPEFYGALSYGAGAEDTVAFAYTFTTQTAASELLEVRRGLYGEGPFARLAAVTPDLAAGRLADTGRASCTPEVLGRPYVLRGEQLRRIFREFGEQFGLGAQDVESILETYRWVSHVVVGTVRSPYLLGDPRSTDPDDHWQINPRTGEIAHQGEDVVPFWLVVPRATERHAQPFPISFYGHGYTSSPIEALAYAGAIARHGVATMGLFAPGHGHDLPVGSTTLLRGTLGTLCYGAAAEPLLRDRARDLNGDGIPDSGGDFWTSYTFHTRDMVRQTVLDHMQVVRAFRAFDGRALVRPAGADPQDYNGNGLADDVAGDFDADGRVDAGGVDARGAPLPWYTWGESLGGIISMVLGSAEPLVHASVPVAGGGGLPDIGIRSRQGGVIEAVALRIMGPLLVTVPARELPPRRSGTVTRTRTSCGENQLSLRWIVPDVNRTGELEAACVELADRVEGERAEGAMPLQPGDDVLATNLRSGESRCARVAAGGRVRLALPSDRGDRTLVTVFRGAAFDDYGACRPREGAAVRATLSTYRVGEGACGYQCGHIPQLSLIDPPRWDVYRTGSPLVAPAEGLGMRRQTPAFRRFMFLAQPALDPADPINFAPLYFLRPVQASDAPLVPHGVLNINTAGDQNVPLSAGNAFSRAAGLIPFFAPPSEAGPSAAVLRHFAELVAPASVFQRYGTTPNQLLIDRGVFEGIPWLQRAPTPAGRDMLFDPEDLAEGDQPYGHARLSAAPLRMVRASRLATLENLEAIWRPSTGEVLSGNLNAYILPSGKHGFDPPGIRRDPPVRRCGAGAACGDGARCRAVPAGWGVCEPMACAAVRTCGTGELCVGVRMEGTNAVPTCARIWDDGEYFTNLVGRYFETNGRDIPYYTAPATHRCMESSSCEFMATTPR